MAEGKNEKEKFENLGEERVMTPPNPAGNNGGAGDTPPADAKKSDAQKNAETSTDEKPKETGDTANKGKGESADTDKKEKDAKNENKDKKTEKTKSAEKSATDSGTQTVSAGEPSVSIAPYANNDATETAYTPQPLEWGPEKDSKINLNVYKREESSKMPIRNFIAEICDMKGYKKEDNEKRKASGEPEIKMSKKLAAANLIWLGAKLTVACTVFGPIAGSWLVAQYTNKDKASKLESKMQNLAKFPMI